LNKNSDAKQSYGAIGYLRPSNLVASLLAQMDDEEGSRKLMTVKPNAPPPAAASIMLGGVVRSSVGGKPLAGAIVGLIPIGTSSVTETNLLAWGGSNADGKFKFNNPVPPGRYTLKAKALGHEPYSREIEIAQTTSHIVVEMRASPNR